MVPLLPKYTGLTFGKLLQLKSEACKQCWKIPPEAMTLAELKTQLSGKLVLILVSQWQQQFFSDFISTARDQL